MASPEINAEAETKEEVVLGCHDIGYVARTPESTDEAAAGLYARFDAKIRALTSLRIQNSMV
jgi:hypothetical protein